MNPATEQRQSPWAVREETYQAISKLVSGQLTAEQLAEVEGKPEPEAVVRRGASRMTGGIAVLNLTGLITPRPSFLSLLFGGGGGLVSFREAFDDAMNSDDISAILINIDSPGGRVDLVPETAAQIRNARGKKPITAIANTMAASAAYWIGAQADELVVTPSGQVGSVGVFICHEDWSGFNEQLGIDPTYISAGKYKTEGNPDEPLTDEARAAFQQDVDDIYAMFVSDVAKGRGVAASKVKSDYGEGRTLTAKRAQAAGMVDRVDTFEGTVARMVSGRRGGRASASADLDAVKASIDAGDLSEEEVVTALQLSAANTPAAPAADPAPAGDPAPEPQAEPPVDLTRLADTLFGTASR